MFEKANLLIGIFKTDDCTKTVSVIPGGYENVFVNAVAECAAKEE